MNRGSTAWCLRTTKAVAAGAPVLACDTHEAFTGTQRPLQVWGVGRIVAYALAKREVILASLCL